MSDAHGVPLDTDAVTRWMSDRTDLTPPLTATQVAGGRSNLTYTVHDADDRVFVLRRPPLGTLLPGAHDMSREARIMEALGKTDVPVPEVIGFEQDHDVLGCDFYVMRFVDGLILRSTEDGLKLDEAARANACRSLGATMAKMHAVDPVEAGLVKPGKGDNYIARQLHVWTRQMSAQGDRDLPVARAVHDRLAANIPPQQGIAIVHGDYRLDNTIVTPEGEVAAVLDWELWTAGDPLADVGITMVYWGDPDEEDPLLGRPTSQPGYGGKRDFLASYVAAGGHDIPEQLLSYYLAFGTWRLAAILEGVYQRNRAGAYGDAEDGWRIFEQKVAHLFDAAARHADAAGI